MAGIGEIKERTRRLKMSGFVSPEPPTLVWRCTCAGGECKSVGGLVEPMGGFGQGCLVSSIAALETSASEAFETGVICGGTGLCEATGGGGGARGGG